MSQRPNIEQQRNFLLRLYFGADGDQIGWFISRAYRDMSRTLHYRGTNGARQKFSQVKDAKELVAKARKGLRKSLCELEGRSVPTIPRELSVAFDQWHRRACDNLISCFHPFPCHYGQAQKWVNMAIKYSWFFRDGSELEPWYPVAHVPVDDFILSAAKKVGIECPRKAWSRWGRQEYEALQSSIRDHATNLGTTPLAIEHDWWMVEGIRTEQANG